MLYQYLHVLNNSNFDRYRNKINQENRVSLDLVITASGMILIVNFIMSLIMGESLIHGMTLLFQIVYLCLAVFLYFGYLRKKEISYTKWIYLLEIPVILIAVFDAVYYDSTRTTFTFMTILLLYPLFILDKPVRIHLFIAGLALFYALIAGMVEPVAVYRLDMVHLTDIMLMAIGSSVFFSIVRLRSIIYADHIEEIAQEDPLTGLYNRAGAKKHIHSEEPGIFIYLDLDKFKGVNDTFGHEEGDQILIETAHALKMNFRKEDIIIRLGGDEFAVYSPGNWTSGEIENRLSKLLESIHEMTMKGNAEVMTASIGCAWAPHGCDSAEELARKADQAMYEAKRAGKNQYHIVTVE